MQKIPYILILTIKNVISTLTLNYPMIFSPLEQFDQVLVGYIELETPFYNFEISLFHGFLVMVFIIIFLIIWIWVIKDTQGVIAKNNYQLLGEKLYLLVLNIIKQQTGEKGYIYFPFILTMFVFILLANLFSLFPFSFAITSHIINIVYLTITLVSSLFLIGCINFGIKFLRLFIPESPFLLLFLLIPIELFSYIIRAFSMALRLSANIMAGHTLVFIVSGFLLKLTIFFLLAASLILVAIYFLEFGVALLQAYVFTVLFTIYLKEALYENAH